MTLTCPNYLDRGSRLGWFVDPDDRSILVFRPQQQPDLCKGDRILPVLSSLDLNLTADCVFDWLKMG